MDICVNLTNKSQTVSQKPISEENSVGNLDSGNDIEVKQEPENTDLDQSNDSTSSVALTDFELTHRSLSPPRESTPMPHSLHTTRFKCFIEDPFLEHTLRETK